MERTCVICEKVYYKDGKEFNSRGHNAQPVKEGRCCDDCNYTVVIPARLRLVAESAKWKDLKWKHLKKGRTKKSK